MISDTKVMMNKIRTKRILISIDRTCEIIIQKYNVIITPYFKVSFIKFDIRKQQLKLKTLKISEDHFIEIAVLIDLN
jgi:hypothetical protein